MAKDRFSEQSENYALYRPHYPEQLFAYILSFVTERNTAWDCATGNGQSALPLSNYFRKVVATDISQKQLEKAPQKNNIEYLVCPAEETPFPSDSINLITVSQAYHWLNWKRFHAEAIRVAKTNCVVAVWMYDLLSSWEDKINLLIQHLYKNVSGPYWDAERRHVDEHYKHVQFDFESLPSKEFFMETSFTRDQLLGYFSTWSATRNFIKAKNYSPIKEIEDDLRKLWPQNESKLFHFPLVLKLGRIVK
jgi:ubiquinone/menaquinone biosynthesis C-methylase UbiE